MSTLETKAVNFDLAHPALRLANRCARRTQALWRALLLALCPLIMLALFAGAALAQGGADGFDPNVNGAVFAVVVQSSGKVIIGGNFTSVNGVARSYLARLNPNGTLDTTFTAQTDGSVTALAQQANGQILLGGVFNVVNGQTRNNLARLNSGGTLDSFNPNPNGVVSALAVQQDGKILAGGGFTTMGNLSAQRIARLLANGDLDEDFITSVNDGSVQDLDGETDGQIVIGGTVTSVNGQTRNHLARLGHRGGLDQNFNPNVNGLVYAVRVLAGGRIVFCGNFTMVGAQTRNRLARLNDDGSLDAGFNPNLNANASVLAVQPDGDFLVGGTFTNAGGQVRNHLARFHLDGSLDTTFAALINDAVGAIAVQPDLGIVIGGSFTAVNLQTRSRLARLYPAKGTLDSDLTSATDGVVYAVALQPDGKILIGGDFTTVAGQTRNRIARLNADGSLDGAFNPNASNIVYAIALQPDGRVLVGGVFVGIGGGLHPGLARLKANGALDASFTAGTNNETYAIVVQPDGKIVIGGAFDSVSGTARNHMARLDANGNLEAGFTPGINGTVRALALQTDGKIVIGGNFTNVTGFGRNFIARLASSGAVDQSFNPGASNAVHALAVMAGGEILVGGAFTALGGQSHIRIGRLESNGAIDASFTLGANDTVNCFAEQMNGKTLVGGDFTQFGGQSRNHLARFNYDNTMDSLDTLITGTTVNGLAVQTDGKIVIGGNYSLIGGQVRNNIGRYHSNEFVNQKLTVNNTGTQIDWTFIGAAPSFDRVVFELSTNGVDFSPLVAATSVSGGWRATGLSLQPVVNFYVRARGFYSSGLANGSGSLYDAVTAAYLIPCFFNVSPTAVTHGGGGGSFLLDVTAFNQTCSWTVQSNAAWITPAVFSGTGSGNVGYMLTANPGLQRTGTMTVAGQTVTITQLSAVVCPTINITPTTLSAGTVGASYLQMMTATGGAAPYTFEPSPADPLPPGLSISQFGQITGTPTTAGTFISTIKATDANGCPGTKAYTLTINPAGGGGGNAGLQFYPLAHPVRLLDTRPGEIGCDAPAAQIAGQTSRTQTAAGRTCDGLAIPANAKALTGNITTVQSGGGYLTLYPSSAQQPLVSNSNYLPNQVVNNVFTVGLGDGDGAFKIFVTTGTHVVVDVTGYYAPPAAGGLYFHPLPKPIRLLETRAGESGCFAPGAALTANSNTSQMGQTACGGVTIPATAKALVGNATTVNPQAGGYLTLYPADAAQPLVASSNFGAGQVINAPFTVGLSAAGAFKIFTTATTDLVIDVLGYYSTDANDANGAGLLFNPLPKPIRLLETRAGELGFDTPGAPILAGTTRGEQARITYDGVTISNTARAIVGNATVVNAQGGYLTFWPSNASQPLVGSRWRIQDIGDVELPDRPGVQSSLHRWFALATTDLVIDVAGFFAP